MKNGNGEILVGASVIFKEGREKILYLLIKDAEGDWEIPKTTVRRGESSVRAVIRHTSEQGNMNVKVIDEVDRATGQGTVNGKSVTYKYIYYLLFFKAGAEILGIGEVAWFDYATAVKKLSLKREKDVFKKAFVMIKEWQKKRKKK